jgi:hypothetical protein
MCFLARRGLALIQQQQQQQTATSAAAVAADDDAGNAAAAAAQTDITSGDASSRSGISVNADSAVVTIPISSSSSSAGPIEALEVDHCSCRDLQVLLGAAMGSGRLDKLTTVDLNWCCVGGR